ncbi:hypothetical protein JHK82_056900 [Glycine max]|nr:hypothetical protein JHK84_056777 [Glycine max]KAG5078205.1 hypothetical protein JHK82_056900 [Glycine max]
MASPPMAALEGLIHGGLENLQQKLPRSAEATYIHFSIFAWNWLPRTTFHDEYIRDEEYVTSIAATTFAFHSLEEAELRNLKK